jgi:hypothetical protein
LTAAEVNYLVGVTSNVQTQFDGKADLVALGSPALAGNFAGLDVNGNLTDSGSRATDFATAVHTHDATTDLTNFDVELANHNLDTLGDVAYTGLADGHILEYDTGTSSWINVLASSTLVTIAGPQTITGAKTFSANTTFSSNVLISGDLTVNGTTTTINATNLEVSDRNITLNAGYVGPASGSTGSGLHVDRGFGGSPITDYAVLTWNESTQRWEGGIVGSETAFAVESQTVAQPHYEIVTAPAGSPAQAVYDLGFDVPAPASGSRAALQVFVNGIKQIEGAGKAYTVSYGVGSPAHVQVTFNAGSEPAGGDDVEFYGFGYID